MDFDTSMRISASGLTANRVYMNVLSSNLANVNTTKTSDGEPYKRRIVIYESAGVEDSFHNMMERAMHEDIYKVRVVDVVPDEREFREVFDPYHPDADENGIVRMPNITPIEEMANLIAAARSYEANLAALQTAKQLSLKALEIGR